MYTIFHNLIIEAPSKVVFNAISNPMELENWWPLTCSGDQNLGGEYNFYFGEPYNWFGKVAAFEKGKSFHIKMTKSDEDWNTTTFGFDLEPKEKGTYVRFFHKDWPICNDEYKNSAFCWALLLSGLKEYVEEGKVIPFIERN